MWGQAPIYQASTSAEDSHNQFPATTPTLGYPTDCYDRVAQSLISFTLPIVNSHGPKAPSG